MNSAATLSLARIRHVVLDMDGTIYRGGTLFPCTRPFLDRLRVLGLGCTFLTNNSSRSSADYLAGMTSADTCARAKGESPATWRALIPISTRVLRLTGRRLPAGPSQPA